MAELVIVVDFEIKDGMLNDFLPLVQANARNCVEKEPGCSQFDVLQVKDQPDHVTLYEVYDDAAAFEAHRTMPHVVEFLTTVKPMIAKQAIRRFDRSAAHAKS